MHASRDQRLGAHLLAMSSTVAALSATLLLALYWPGDTHIDDEAVREARLLGAAGPAGPTYAREPEVDPGDLLVADLEAIKRWVRLDLADIEQAGFAWADVTTPGRWRHGAGKSERHQAYSSYQHAQRKSYDGVRQVIVLRPVGPWPEHLAHLPPLITRFLMLYFHRPVRWEDGLDLPPGHRPSSDGAQLHLQYPTTPLLERLEKTLPEDAIAHVGITARDLYPSQDWAYVFGMADLHKRVGVVSVARLVPQFWGFVNTPLARRLALLRILKVLAHETGHMLGINHCRAFSCVMSGCSDLMEHDTTPANLCPLCMSKLAWRLNLRVGRRYRELAQFYLKHGLGPEARWYHRQAARMADARRPRPSPAVAQHR